jgi:hypothetical protein
MNDDEYTGCAGGTVALLVIITLAVAVVVWRLLT